MTVHSQNRMLPASVQFCSEALVQAHNLADCISRHTSTVEAPDSTQEATDEPEAAGESRYPARRRQKSTSRWEAKPRANVAATTLMVEAGKAAARNGAAGSVETAAGSVDEPEPATYKEAMASKHAAEWRTAMDLSLIHI